MIHAHNLLYYNSYKPLVIHLVGLPKQVFNASKEIQSFAENLSISSKIIENNNKIDIFREYNKSFLIINNCNILSCNNIFNLHKFVNVTSFYTYNSFAFLISTKSQLTYEQKLKKCINITDIYNIFDCNSNKRYMVSKYILNN